MACILSLVPHHELRKIKAARKKILQRLHLAYHGPMLPKSMLAMAADPTARQLIAVRCPLPALGEYDVLLKVLACGVCRTDLHIIDGELAPRREAVVPGHEVVGQV